MSSRSATQSIIDQLIQSTGCSTAEEAIRLKAKALVSQYQQMFGEPKMPIDVLELASLQGIHASDDLPIQSPDAELVPRKEGGVEMRVHPDRPETRKRFSIAHEISHTFFPEYEKKEWCRTDARYRDRGDPDQLLEMLCDIGAAELLFPEPWFKSDADSVTSASALLSLANDYQGSREATLRRYAEISDDPVAAVYFSWKLKPKQKGIVDNEYQENLFGLSPEQQIQDALQLRIDYSIPSRSFNSLGHFLPADKSVTGDNPITNASRAGGCVDGDCHLDLGQASGTYHVMAIPLPTPRDQRGPNEEFSVATILRPIDVRKPANKRKVSQADAPTLFN